MGGGPVAAIGRFAELATIRVDDGVVAADWAAGLTMQRIQLGIEASACPSRGRRNADKGRPRPQLVRRRLSMGRRRPTEACEAVGTGASQPASQPAMVTV